MATCERVEIKPEPPPVKYVLTLNEEEAQYVFALMSQAPSLGVLHSPWSEMQKCGIGKGPFRVHRVDADYVS